MLSAPQSDAGISFSMSTTRGDARMRCPNSRALPAACAAHAAQCLLERRPPGHLCGQAAGSPCGGRQSTVSVRRSSFQSRSSKAATSCDTNPTITSHCASAAPCGQQHSCALNVGLTAAAARAERAGAWTSPAVFSSHCARLSRCATAAAAAAAAPIPRVADASQSSARLRR